MKKKLTILLIACILLGTASTSFSLAIYATETVEVTESVDNENSEETEGSKDALDKILENDPLSDENVEKGKTIFTKIVDAAIPFIKSFLLALFDFFVAIGRAVIDALSEM